MKKLYFLLYSSFSVLGFSQTILNQSESATRTVQDPNLVVLAPGFHAISAVSNPFVAKIGASTDTSGGGPSTPSTAGSGNPSGTTDTPTNRFHDTQGNIEVNGGGQLQFTLPIALPPGVKSVAPQINLVYTSGSGNGIAGYGWNISGITAIARMGKTIEKDGVVAGVKLDYSDYYSFNGQRLILKHDSPAAYGQNGAEYVTEKFSNIKIKSIGRAYYILQPLDAPNHFEVTFEDGSQAWYGATTSGENNARTLIEYNIVKWKDAQGNYITYNYTQSNNVAVISSVQWGGNETLGKTYFNEINFEYNTNTTRELKEISYVKGEKFVQSKLLNNIIVKTNNQQFKKYKISYKATTENYQFVQNVTEYNANNEVEPANAASFEYNTNQQVSDEIAYPYNPTNFNTKKYGDFNYDGITDYIEYLSNGTINFRNSVYLNTPTISLSYDASKFTSSDFSKAKIITFKKNQIVKNKAGLIIPHKVPSSVSGKYDYEFQIYSVDINTHQLVFEYSKIIPYTKYNLLSDDGQTDCVEYATSLSEMESYDYNGDGISELILSFKASKRCIVYNPDEDGPLEIPAEETSNSLNFLLDKDNTEHSNLTESDDPNLAPPIGGEYEFHYYSSLVFFDLDENKAVNPSYYQLKYSNEGATTNFTFADFNGDGLADIIEPNSGKFSHAYNIRKNANSYETVNVENFSTTQYSGMFNNALYGDFNGDAKTDILVPQADKNSNWNLYISNGKSFSQSTINNFIYFSAGQEITHQDRHRVLEEGNGCDYYTAIYYQYNVGDLDADGKSEIIVTSVTRTDHEWSAHHDEESTSVTTSVFSPTKSISGSGWNFSSVDSSGDLKFYRTKSWSKPFADKVIPFSTLTLNHTNRQIILIGRPDDCGGSDCNYNYALQYNYQYLPELARLNKVTQGGIITDIEYKELDPVLNPTLFTTVKQENFPYLEVEKLNKSYVVSQLKQINRKQDFRYRGMITHLQGKGMVGFRQTARSSWYTDNLVNTKIWSGAEIDPLNDGIPIKEWSIKTNDENQIFPTDISENNTQLLSFRSTEYRFDKLSNNKVSATVPIKSITKDFMQDIRTESSIQYDAYYLPITTTSNTNNGFAISTTNLQYFPPNLSGIGKDYYVGRLQSKIEQMQVYGDTKGSKEEYTYENNLLKTLKTWNRDNTGWLNEEYTYDDFGNITQKVITSSIDGNSKTDKAEYDAKGRFVIKKTDNVGLETNITYNDWGQVLTQTDPLGNVLTNEYDDWGKLLKSKTNLGGTTTYEYKKESNGDAVVNEHAPDGTEKISYTNKLGQNYLSKARKFGQGQYVSVMTYFDGLGRKIWESEPYSGEYPNLVNSIEYDDYSRPVRAIAFTGKVVENTYNGRTATATETNANNRFKKQTADPIGNIISTEDLGGVIYFKFNAAGENIEANYEGNIVKTSYDAWGNKVRFEDPSNGVYEYQYNGYMGAISKTKSPKGEKTYEYNNLGQLTTQKEKSTTGNTTDKTINFSYNSKGMIVQKSGTSLGKFFGSGITYDDYGRVLSSYEDSNGKYFMKKGITYDDKMRVTSYEKSLYSSGILTKVSIENEYDTWSGELYRVKEKGTGKILWQLNEVNAKGQVTQAKLGNVTINNTYATNGFLNNVNHTNTAGNTILQIGYSFNAIKNELNSRTTGGDFNIIEQFAYDSNNRLVNWTDPVSGIFTQNQKRNVYDNKGRITQNDQVGTFSFSTRKLYQPVGITLNAEGTNNYNNDLLQKITYNENNDPVFIDGLKGDVAFEYGLTSMRQKVTYGGNFAESAEGKFTKYYSEDGSYEIIKNNQTGEEKHLIYIGGSPYESNIIYLKEFSTDNAKFVFLHKDYLGSILAITDEAGTKLEQRHFDAWGNLTHLKIGNKAIITDKEKIRNYLSDGNLVVDRGYTSHEHFAEVGLIHMNGRLYDPLLRRFLNADENIQDPYNTQNYNKYGYVMNNPLMFSDPSGEFFIFGFLAGMASKFLAGLITAAIIGAGAGLVTYTLSVALTGQKWQLGGALKSMFFGAVGGAASFGIGSIFTNAAGTATKIAGALGKFGTAVVQGGCHAISQGVLGLMQGQSFLSSAVAGFAGSLAASGWSGIMGTSGGAMIAFGALSGGIGAELSGGNFWQGALIGGVVAGLNHAMHEMDGPGDGDDPPGKKSIKESLKEKYNETKQKLSEMKEYVEDFYGGVNDFIDTYDEMKTANWKNSDKYFHSKANYKATLRGPGGEAAAIKMSNLREITDQYIKGDSRASSIADQKANLYGRQQAHRRANFTITSENMRFIINKYRPISLPTKY